jgi:hypothetical protein
MRSGGPSQRLTSVEWNEIQIAIRAAHFACRIEGDTTLTRTLLVYDEFRSRTQPVMTLGPRDFPADLWHELLHKQLLALTTREGNEQALRRLGFEPVHYSGGMPA